MKSLIELACRFIRNISTPHTCQNVQSRIDQWDRYNYHQNRLVHIDIRIDLINYNSNEDEEEENVVRLLTFYWDVLLCFKTK